MFASTVLDPVCPYHPLHFSYFFFYISDRTVLCI
uniref:Uncharacterized protein n=1 Tax=Anguilla anguilla TaxID=7936 RepID=A0A0E9VWZ3_ANGAN